MSDEKSKSAFEEQPTPPIPWFRNPDGMFEGYSNYLHINWTLYDLRIRFGNVIPSPDSQPADSKWIISEDAAVSVPWGQAKVLRDMLIEAVQRYESVNGELKIPNLAP